MEILQWLQKWYTKNRAGHSEEGIQLKNRGNEGWDVVIGLRHTYLDKQIMTPAILERSETDWYKCKVVSNVFRGQGGPGNLVEILEIFQEWALENEVEMRE